MKRFALKACIAATAFLSFTLPASAATISLSLIDSFARGSSFDGPFGLAYDGSNIWWSDNGGILHEMSTAGVDTGNTISTGIWSELAWDGSHLLQAQGTTITKWNTDGTSAGTGTITAGISCGGLVDGLDFDQGELWCSPDVSVIYRISGDLTTPIGAQPAFGGGGGYSGVERIQATNGTNYVVVVNDASNPRQLCLHAMDYTELGCQQFANARYEGLAFDGRYVYAADYYGARIDKYDILGSDGGSVIDPGGNPNVVPVPAAGWLLGAAIFGFAGLRRRRGLT
jgi:hypothetical protein